MTPRILAKVEEIAELVAALDATIDAALNADPTPVTERPRLTVVDGGRAEA